MRKDFVDGCVFRICYCVHPQHLANISSVMRASKDEGVALTTKTSLFSFVNGAIFWLCMLMQF